MSAAFLCGENGIEPKGLRPQATHVHFSNWAMSRCLGHPNKLEAFFFFHGQLEIPLLDEGLRGLSALTDRPLTSAKK